MLFAVGDFRTPGQYIEALLEARGWNKRLLAVILGIDETVVNKIISGKRRLDAEIALQLAELFEVPVDRFMELQAAYDLARARIVARPDPGRATRARLFGDLPVADMIKRGWLDAEDVRDVNAVETALTKFFGASSVDDIEILPHAAKKTRVATQVNAAQLAWIYRVKQVTADMLTGRFSETSVSDAIRNLWGLLGSPEESRKAPRILSEAGIRFAIVETLPGAKIDGVCFWINEKTPVIGMSMRYDRIDNFWFVLRHELEHVRLGHGQTALILDELDGERSGTGDDIPTEERLANSAAAEFCIPTDKMEKFIARKSPFFAERDVLGFAATLRVHPGLVAGQLQRKTGRYDRFRDHLAKIRHCVAPSAIVDGWGDVAPVDL